jgi:hypothetical protein
MVSGSISPSTKPYERYGDAGQRHAERRATQLSNHRQVCLHSGQKQQHQDAELRDGIDHRLLLWTRGKDHVLQVGPQRAQYGGAKQDSGDQLAHHRRLADPQNGLAQEAPEYQEQGDLAHEHHLGGTGAPGSCALSRQ